MIYQKTLPVIFSAAIAFSTFSLGLAETIPLVVALSANEVNAVAKDITVRIDRSGGHGSGIIIEKQGNTYYILTNWHVVAQAGNYEVVTPDGKRHEVSYSLIKRVPGVDLAVVPFSSNETYRLARLTNSDQVVAGKTVYVAGWPRSGGSLRQPVLIVTEGQLTRRQAPKLGYTLVYTNLASGGMSGGPVLDEDGRVVAVNGILQLEENSDNITAGGIEINTFVQWRAGVSLPRVAGTPAPGGGSSARPAPVVSGANFAVASALKGPAGVVSSVALAPSHFVSGNSDGTISVWNLASGGLEKTLRGHGDAVNAVALSPDGQTLVSGSDDKTLKIWNLQTGEVLRTLNGHSDAVVAVAMTPEWIASGSWDKTVKIWNRKTGELVRSLTGHSALVGTVAIASDYKTLASGSKDGSINLWNLQTGELIRTLKGNNLSILSIAFSPDGKTLASGSGDGTIGVWNLSNGQLMRRLSGHTDGVWSVTIGRDGNTLVSGSWDKTVKLWDIRSGALKGNLTGHSGYVTAVAMSEDGRMIISAGWEGQIKIWKR